MKKKKKIHDQGKTIKIKKRIKESSLTMILI